MLIDKAKIDDIITHGFRAEHCYADRNRLIVEAIYHLREAGSEVDVVTVASYLRSVGKLAAAGGSPYLADIQDATPATLNVLHHASLVMEAWRLRRAIDICRLGSVKGYDPMDDVQAFLEGIEKDIGEVAHTRDAQKIEPVGTVLVREVSRITLARERGETTLGVATGLDALDALTAGLFRGNLYIIAARPGMGKTALLTSLLAHIARPKHGRPGHACLFASLEMPRDQIALRFGCHESQVSMNTITTGRATRAEWQRLIDETVTVAEMPIWVDDTPAMSLLEFHAAVRQMKRKVESGAILCAGLGAVAIDYLQLMRGVRNKGDSREQEVSSLSRGLKEIAKLEDVPVIALSQLNREVEKNAKDKRPKLSDLRESGSIEQDADSVWFIYRDAYYDREGTDPHHAEIIVSKQRSGPTGYAEVFYDRVAMRFKNLAKTSDFDEFDTYFDK